MPRANVGLLTGAGVAQRLTLVPTKNGLEAIFLLTYGTYCGKFYISQEMGVSSTVVEM
jgi:hypothetical protein